MRSGCFFLNALLLSAMLRRQITAQLSSLQLSNDFGEKKNYHIFRLRMKLRKYQKNVRWRKIWNKRGNKKIRPPQTQKIFPAFIFGKKKNLFFVQDNDEFKILLPIRIRAESTGTCLSLSLCPTILVTPLDDRLLQATQNHQFKGGLGQTCLQDMHGSKWSRVQVLLSGHNFLNF